MAALLCGSARAVPDATLYLPLSRAEQPAHLLHQPESRLRDGLKAVLTDAIADFTTVSF